MLFKRTAKKLSEVSQINFENEKEVQTLIEENLEAVFGLKFLATEFSILNMRFDTVAFDSENNAFIERKHRFPHRKAMLSYTKQIQIDFNTTEYCSASGYAAPTSSPEGCWRWREW